MVATDGQNKMQKNIVFINGMHGRNLPSAKSIGSVSKEGRDGAPSRQGCVANGQITKASNK